MVVGRLENTVKEKKNMKVHVNYIAIGKCAQRILNEIIAMQQQNEKALFNYIFLVSEDEKYQISKGLVYIDEGESGYFCEEINNHMKWGDVTIFISSDGYYPMVARMIQSTITKKDYIYHIYVDNDNLGIPPAYLEVNKRVRVKTFQEERGEKHFITRIATEVHGLASAIIARRLMSFKTWMSSPINKIDPFDTWSQIRIPQFLFKDEKSNIEISLGELTVKRRISYAYDTNDNAILLSFGLISEQILNVIKKRCNIAQTVTVGRFGRREGIDHVHLSLLEIQYEDVYEKLGNLIKNFQRIFVMCNLDTLEECKFLESLVYNPSLKGKEWFIIGILPKYEPDYIVKNATDLVWKLANNLECKRLMIRDMERDKQKSYKENICLLAADIINNLV